MPQGQASEPGVPDPGGGPEHHPPFDFKAAMLHHNMPYPAWELFHGRPWIVFDLGRYAAMQYGDLQTDPGSAAADGTPYLDWAAEIVRTPDFRYDAHRLEPVALSRCMAMVAHDRAGLVFPRWLSFFNQQLFFGLFALSLVTVILAITCRRRPGRVAPAGRLHLCLDELGVFIVF
jgi:hypothetical protein